MNKNKNSKLAGFKIAGKIVLIIFGVFLITLVFFGIYENYKNSTSSSEISSVKTKVKEYKVKNPNTKYQYVVKNNLNTKELENYYNGDKIKSFPNPKNNLFGSIHKNSGEKTLNLNIYAFQAYRVVAKGYCSNGVGCNIDNLENNYKVRDSITDSEIIQNENLKGKNYQIITNSTLYFDGNFIKTFWGFGNSYTRIVPLEVEDGVFFELREYLGFKTVSNFKCEKTCIINTYY